jgi:CheY-like chemotaxis protein
MWSILYVDNKQVRLDAAKTILERKGNFNVDVTDSSEDALIRFSAKSYDAIICEFKMPEIDGIELLKQIRSINNQIPFIILINKSSQKIQNEINSNMWTYFLQKRRNPNALFSQTAEFLTDLKEQIEERDNVWLLSELKSNDSGAIEDRVRRLEIITKFLIKINFKYVPLDDMPLKTMLSDILWRDPYMGEIKSHNFIKGWSTLLKDSTQIKIPQLFTYGFLENSSDKNNLFEKSTKLHEFRPFTLEELKQFADRNWLLTPDEYRKILHQEKIEGNKKSSPILKDIRKLKKAFINSYKKTSERIYEIRNQKWSDFMSKHKGKFALVSLDDQKMFDSEEDAVNYANSNLKDWELRLIEKIE